MAEIVSYAMDLSSTAPGGEAHKLKKRKLSGDSNSDAKSVLSPDSFKGFRLKNVLNEDLNTKTIFLEGEFESADGKAVVILEKQPFGKDTVQDILTQDTTLVNNFNNNIYSSYKGFPKAELNGIKATIIHPATEKHISKYMFQSSYVVKETPELYRKVVLPHIEEQQLSLQWVYNILDHKSEVERIIFEDDNSETGFVLLPDLKWDGSQTSNLYAIAICHARGLRSLRDLTADHLPLLKNIYSKATSILKEKYQLPQTKLRAYLHYLPSYYHLHIHFTNIHYDAPGTQPERAHLLNTVISNIELIPDYYQKAVLTYCVKEKDPLYEKLKASDAFE